MDQKIEVRESLIKNAGRGVFALVDIEEGEVIETCPILIFSRADTAHIMETLLGDYVYAYERGKTLFVMGYGSLYNHHNQPNTKYELLVDEDTPENRYEMCFTALRDIAVGEEIYINYGKDHFSK